jgi:hypothetical protein
MAAEPAAGRDYVVKHGNSLWQIARRAYGAGTRFVTIYSANPDQIRDPTGSIRAKSSNSPNPDSLALAWASVGVGGCQPESAGGTPRHWVVSARGEQSGECLMRKCAVTVLGLAAYLAAGGATAAGVSSELRQ